LGVKYQGEPRALIQAMITGLAALKSPCVPE